ncbi:hypothetical protein RIF29_19296 [Crotalaria pallida]|uniref:Leucine-rich repeat-containing N-terminal plant-type domain-containing protein n=1 Tax=Crotalaria pallida TaxID=3830 RepID=A0AAN9I5D6_CROPI
MFSCRFYLFCLVAILCISLCVGNSNAKKCVDTERHALLTFKAGLINQKGYLSSWAGEDCCKWKGITCDNSTGHVTVFEFSYEFYEETTMKGKIDSSICELQYLTFLSLSGNFEGKIPECIGSLGQMILLDLGGNGLVGAIPHALGNLSNLQTLDLSYNDYLVANDLEWVSRLSHLRYLDLSYANLNQAVDWMSLVSKLPSLSHIALDFCGLPQFNLNSIPKMNSSTLLDYLSLSGNHLNSSTLSWVLNVGEILTYVDLSSNELEGCIPKSFRSLCKLETLILFANKLSGQLSDYVSRLCSNSIRYLDLSHNQLNGSIPYTIGQLSNLFELSISSNNLTGIIDEAHLSNLSYLGSLYMDHTSLSFNFSSKWIPPFQLDNLYASSCHLGPNFPLWLKHQRALFELQISNTGISGSPPKWFWDLTPRLIYLNVSHNKLSGALPKLIPHIDFHIPEAEWDLSFNNFSGLLPKFLPSLGLLSVSNNIFSGSISSFCVTPFPILTYIDLSNNFLEGQLPNCWGQIQRLQVLNLAANKFSGRIPESLGSLPEIETIHLNNNNFSGEIPSLARCLKLKVMDFGDNNLGGTLPAWVGQNLDHLIILRLRVNKFKGRIPANLCNLLHLQVLDLSENNITGEIPECLNQITSLTNINFTRKTLSYSTSGYLIKFDDFEYGWFIDRGIFAWKGANREYGKNLGLLTAIDLSCNQLNGEIPVSMTKLAALASLNLSRNNLTGFIPNNIGHMKMLESLDLSKNYLYA